MSFNLKLYKQVWQKLDQSKIIAQVTDIATPIPLVVFERIPSTNTKLWELIDRGVKNPHAAIALEQTA
ncbi:MAG: biotin--[acetyl-CoA-carboxylase] ligase, partial [Pleurocapsa sp.]